MLKTACIHVLLVQLACDHSRESSNTLSVSSFWTHRNTVNVFMCTCTFSGYSKWVEYLVDHKADVNVTNKFGMTPLVLAVRHAHPHLVLYLLSHGANPHHQNHTGQTALHYASCTGEYNVGGYIMLLDHNRTVLVVALCFLYR